MKNFIKLIVLALLFTACGDFEPVVYDPATGQTLAYFSDTTSNLEVLVDDSGAVTIEVSSTTLSTSDRQINISVNEELSTANAENYAVPATAVIPANEYSGTFVVTGVDVSVETTTESIVLQMDAVDGGIVSSATHQVSIYQVCPIPADFMIGEYEIVDVLATVGPGNGTSNFLTGTVMIEENTATSRKFVSSVLPAFTGGAPVDVTLDLVCNEIIMSDIGSGLGCGGGGGAEYIYTAADMNSTYDIADDNVIIVNYTEDPDGSCGGPFEASFMLTKL
ncbi:MAG: hypothetical protein BM564_08030 [Bacteroidetes bacterium MedPE-SWsnd-G2]|nr:MAG: hypothetical protein BM564_08030 [Bacteroidetes bacterium MedPE-SWsnd-G2]